ncbi:MAG TPA: prephenate dehydrogenase/arogenate dehydrogenase family protein [Candidatus Hydrogenedentes bacterium]|nr:prephenate dehydrogenase/arogenate dehydrogenase family protein [Candidatus Hydrogenedentota bacterium]HPG68807.1 prephenate dehydrogenase/arogenate dehydrogenase family protein [Candidatus Hydrogenedentota bacterium]
MMPHFETVTIIGVGLLGGSLGLALKSRGLARTVRGVGHRASTLDTALRLGAVDTVSLDAAEASRDADLIVLCTPAAAVPDKLDEIRSAVDSAAVVTDVASTKSLICTHAAASWPKPIRFIGSHPMAGSEKSGPEHADAGLYADAVTFITPTAEADPEANDIVTGLWEAVGARVTKTDPETHDDLVARTSHLPHVVASCLARRLAGQKDAKPFVGSGFRDTTRIALGRPEIWRDICLTNRRALLNELAAVQADLARIAEHIRAGDAEAVAAFFESGRAARKEATEE